MDEDMQKCCRICLDVESEHVPILGDPTIHLHVKSCLAISITPNDDLPKTICMSCVTQLGEFYKFQLNAHCSQDWLVSSIEDKAKKSNETKTPIQPLPDSEYNSDSLLEFLNNTANIEEYLNNLGKEDIPSIVNLLERNENTIASQTKPTKASTLSARENMKPNKHNDIKMEIDVLDSDIAIVKEILMKETESRTKMTNVDKFQRSCFACQAKFDNISKLTQHLSTCDIALRTCINCNVLLDSKHKMQQHYLTHTILPSLSCNCGKQFQSKDKLTQHHKTCLVDHGAAMGCVYSCRDCGETFKQRFQLFRHARLHVQKSEITMCDVCGHSFRGIEALSRHKSKEHGQKDSDILIYRCKVCNVTSMNRKEIYLHVQNHTSNKESPQHLCESCGKSYSSLSSLLRHLEQHGKKHQCNICFNYFNDQKVLEQHKLDHNKTIMCERCGKTFNSYRMVSHVCI